MADYFIIGATDDVLYIKCHQNKSSTNNQLSSSTMNFSILGKHYASK